MCFLGSRKFIFQLTCLIVILQVFLSATAKSTSQDSWFAPVKDGLGIYIDDHDRFSVSIAHSITQVDSILCGYIDVQELFYARAVISDSLPPPRLEGGKIWSTFASNTDRGAVLLRAVLKELGNVLGIEYFQACVVATPLYLHTSSRNSLSPLIEAVFECPEGAYLSVDALVATEAIQPPVHELEESVVALIAPSGFTYVLGEYVSPLIFDIYPSPPNLQQTLLEHNITAVVVIQDDEMNQTLGSTFGPNSTPIQYVNSGVVSQGAAIMAASGIMGPPVEIMNFALSVVLYGTQSHILINRNSILPRTINITLTTTHDNQRTAIIELREGSRPRLNDTLPLMSLVLDGLPAAPAGALQIHLSVTVDYYYSVVMEASEPISGARTKRVQDLNRGYGGEFLDNFILDTERYHDQDEAYRKAMDNRRLSGGESDAWAVKLAEDSHQLDGL